MSILPYTIHFSTSYSGSYLPEKILQNNPSEQSSRWSSDNNLPPQYLILKLDETAIVQNVTFGKYEKTHVCNLKRFRIYGGLTSDNMQLLLESGLKNDTIPETFKLKSTTENKLFPCRYIKIEPLQSWGTSFNFSIWYVELLGINDPVTVQEAIINYNKQKETQAIRLCLKHFRQHNYLDAFEALSKRTRVQLEHPVLTKLHEELVLHGNFENAEKLLHEACVDDLFLDYIKSRSYKPLWQNISPVSEDGLMMDTSSSRPGMRGGHQMVLDPTVGQSCIYLFGGWDGKKDLADLWRFNIGERRWTCLSWNTQSDGGPTARSCHKMCFDPLRRQIFTLGRYIDAALRKEASLMKNDFYVYDVAGEHWTLITEDTQAMGGPCLIFDHQLAIDALRSTIYVFGGRELRPESTSEELDRPGLNHRYSGLFAYSVPTNTWCRLRGDDPPLTSRMGHSMLFHPGNRQLYIFAGQRAKEYLNDFIKYDVDTGCVKVITDGRGSDTGSDFPAAGFTQRATIDPDFHEIYVLSGLSKDKDKRDHVRNSFWVYSITRNTWSCVYKNEDSTTQTGGSPVQQPHTPSSSSGVSSGITEPVPRYAHQLVYDPERKLHFLFGGNPGRGHPGLAQARLDDLWSLALLRPSCADLLRRCRYLIRRQHYREMAAECAVSSSPCSSVSSSSSGFSGSRQMLAAMQYLQTRVAEVVNHSDTSETRRFQALAGWLFAPPVHLDIPSSTGAESVEPGTSGNTQEPGSGSVMMDCPLTDEDEWEDDPTCLSVHHRLSGSINDDSETNEIQPVHYAARSRLFDTLTRIFPSNMSQPKENLLDLLPN